MIRRAILPAIALATVSSGWAVHQTPVRQAVTQPQATQPAAASYPVIVRMVSRHGTITVTAGPHGPLYSAVSESGKTLVSNATLQQLRTEYPDIHRQVEPTLALDARAD